MKKIININLSGRVIPIEDSAYEKLQAYIESLRRYFINEEGRDEIINDIESRIAELLFEKVRMGSPAITDADIDSVIASMGRPEDFDAETISEAPGQQNQNQSNNYQYAEKKPRGRLYRDGSDKILGGVCSGLANYLNLDPAIVRILFAVVTIGGFGIGVLAYILLWIVLPSREMEGFSGKRLYRNPDDRVIGGVAGGLAAYFNMRASVIRLIFGLPLVISIFIRIVSGMAWNHHYGLGPNIVFGSISGTFILAYIILWMVLPEARSQYEKMEMRGETVDVNTIRQNVKEGMENMKSRAKEWGQEVKQSAQELGGKVKDFTRTRGKAFVAETGEVARRSRNGFGHVIGVLFKIFFLIVFGSIAFGLFIAFIALLFGGIAWWPINHFLWTSNWQQLEAWGTLIFFIGVPLIGFIIWVIRRIIRVRSRSAYLGWTFGGLWVIGWVAAALFAASITKDFRYYTHSETDININQPSKGKLIVKVSQPELEYSGSFGWMSDNRGIDVSDDTMKLSLIKFTYNKSEDSSYHVILKKFSAGSTRQNAIDRADKTQYFITSMDSVLDVGSGFAIDKSSKYRGQRIEIEIRVPVGKKIRFDPSVSQKLNPERFHVYHRSRWNGNNGVQITIENDDYSPWRSGVDYIMGSDGKLKGPDGIIVGDDYRYEENDSIQIKQSIEQKKQELKDLEDRQKNIKSKPTTIIQKKEDKDGLTVAFSPSPVFSLVNQFN